MLSVLINVKGNIATALNSYKNIHLIILLLNNNLICILTRRQRNKLIHTLEGNMISGFNSLDLVKERGVTAWFSNFPNGFTSLTFELTDLNELTELGEPIKTSGNSLLCGLYALHYFLSQENRTKISRLIGLSGNALTENALAVLYYMCGGKKNIFFLEGVNLDKEIIINRIIGVVKKQKKDNNIYLFNSGFHWEPLSFSRGKKIRINEACIKYVFDPILEDLFKISHYDMSSLIIELSDNPNKDTILQFVTDLLEKNLDELSFHEEVKSYIKEDNYQSYISLLWYQRKQIFEFIENKENIYSDYLKKEEGEDYETTINEVIVFSEQDQSKVIYENKQMAFPSLERQQEVKNEDNKDIFFYDIEENRSHWLNFLDRHFVDRPAKKFNPKNLTLSFKNIEPIVPEKDLCNGLLSIQYYLKLNQIEFEPVNLLKMTPSLHLTPEIITFIFEAAGGFANLIFLSGCITDINVFTGTEMNVFYTDKNIGMHLFVCINLHWYAIKEGKFNLEIDPDCLILNVEIDIDTFFRNYELSIFEVVDVLRNSGCNTEVCEKLIKIETLLLESDISYFYYQLDKTGLNIEYWELLKYFKQTNDKLRDFSNSRSQVTYNKPLTFKVIDFKGEKAKIQEQVNDEYVDIIFGRDEEEETPSEFSSNILKDDPNDIPEVTMIIDDPFVSKGIRHLSYINPSLLIYCQIIRDYRIGLLNRNGNRFWNVLVSSFKTPPAFTLTDKQQELDKQRKRLKFLDNLSQTPEDVNTLLLFFPKEILKCIGKAVNEAFSFFKTSFGIMSQWDAYPNLTDYVAHVTQCNLFIIYEKAYEIKQYFEIGASLLFLVCMNEEFYLPNIPLYVNPKDLTEFFQKNKIFNIQYSPNFNKAMTLDRINYFQIIKSLITTFNYSSVSAEILKIVQIGIYKLRHDLIVYMIYRTYGYLNWSEKTLKEDFAGLSEECSRQTPDFYHISIKDNMRSCHIYEISVTINVNMMREKKRNKYARLVEEVKQQCQGRCFFYPVILEPNLASMQRTFSEYLPNTSNELLTFVWTGMNMIANLLLKINSRIGSNFGDMPKIQQIEFKPNKNVLLEEEKIQKYLANSLDLGSIYQIASEFKSHVFYESNKPYSDDIPGILKNLRLATNSFEHLINSKPTFHFVFDPRIAIYPNEKKDMEFYMTGKLSEEQMVIDFFNNVYIHQTGNYKGFEFIYELQQRFLQMQRHTESLEVYMTGEFTNYKRSEFNEKNTILKKLGKPVEHNYLMTACKKIGIDKKQMLSRYHKSVHMNKPIWNPQAFEFYKESGIRYKFNNPKEKKVITVSKSLRLNEDFFAKVESFLGQMTATIDKPAYSYLPDFLLNSQHILDHPFIQKTKEIMHEETKPLLSLLSKTLIYEFAYRYHLISAQLLHIGSFKGRDSEFYFFNTGVKNIFCCIAGRKERRNTDPGVSFFFFGYIPKTEDSGHLKVEKSATQKEIDKENENQGRKQPIEIKLFSELFGPVSYFENGNKYFFCSNWRRLKKTKLAFITDIFFSTLTTAICDLTLHAFRVKKIDLNDVREFYTIRVVLGVNASQRIAEMSMDFKFAIFASLSNYSRLSDLINDKFGPIYPNHLSVWFVFNLLRICKILLKAKEKNVGFVKINVPEFLEDVRQMKSTGGSIVLPGLWSSSHITDFNLFLNSIHAYVHTIKEPVSLHHEGIKAMKTILKFDSLYQGKAIDLKYGLSTSESVPKILNDVQCGFSNSFIYHNTVIFFEKCQIDFNLLLTDNIFKMPLAHLNSTKASIVDANRPKDSHKRYKVHDCLIKRPEIQNMNLITHAEYFFNQTPNQISLADICIKEQYGAKREFYVLDINSKFLCKFVEEIFKKIAKLIDTECISVSGDLKLIKIQTLVNSISRHATVNQQMAYYINGDCTKWSASEMMESFLTLLYGMKMFMPEALYYLLFSIILQWKENKFVQIPESIIRKCNIKTEYNSYTYKGEERIFQFKLEQNFLMGLYNYMSSIKGSIVYESFKNYIEMNFSNVKVEHLEHSDDYLIGISCEPDQIMEIRSIHMKMMRLGGITDSIKKTTISTWYAEFVSLYCFNGHTTYPTIKKIKEVSSALTGNGFQEDSAAICSRTAEVLRVGITFTSSFFFLKMHNWLLADLYGLLPGQRNEDKISNLSLFSKPVEAFGLSECHPLLYLINSGDVNNLRLFKYEQLSKKMLNDLSLNAFEEFRVDDSYEGVIGFKKPIYNYKMSGVKLRKLLKELNYDFKEGQEFWNLHPSLKYHKPNISELLNDYLRSHYSIKQFQRAYEQQSRLSTLLRISRYKSKQVLHAPYFSDELMSIQEYYKHLLIQPVKQGISDMREEFLTNGDTAGILFYEVLASSEYTFSRELNKPRSLAANLTPFYYDPVKVDTPLGLLLLKKYEPVLFEQEESYISLKWPIEQDLKIINKLDEQFIKLPVNRRINFIYNYIMCAKKPIRAIMTPFSDRKELISFLTEMFKYQTSLNTYISIKLNQEIRFINPINPDLPCYMFQGEEITLERAISLSLISIYTCLKFKDKATIGFMKTYFENLKLTTGQDSLTFLNNIKHSDLSFLGFKYSEIHSLMFMKAELCNDYSQVVEFLQIWNSYSYRYKRRAALINNKYVGDTTCEFTHFNTDNMVIFDEIEQKTMFLTNIKSLSKVYVVLMIGAKLVQREFTKDWFLGDVDKALNKFYMNYVDMCYCRNKISANLKPHFLKNQLWVLIQENNALNWVVANFNDNKGEKNYLPVFCLHEYKFEDKPNIHKFDLSQDMEIDTHNASLMLRPGGWVASRFGTSHIYTNPNLFVNIDSITLGGLTLNYVLSNGNLKKMLFHDDPNIRIDILNKNIVINEIPETKVNRFNLSKITDLIVNYQAFKEQTQPSLAIDPQKNKPYNQPSTSSISLPLNIIIPDENNYMERFTKTGTVAITTRTNVTFKEILTNIKPEIIVDQIKENAEPLFESQELELEDLKVRSDRYIKKLMSEHPIEQDVDPEKQAFIRESVREEVDKYQDLLIKDDTGVYYKNKVAFDALFNFDLNFPIDLEFPDEDEDVEILFKSFSVGQDTSEGIINIEQIHKKPDSESVHLPSFLKSINTNQTLWQDSLEIVIKNMLIQNIGVSKFLLLFVGLFFGKYDNYTEIFHNQFHKHLLNQINNLIETKSIWPNVEYLEYYNYSARLEENKIVLYQYRFFMMETRMTPQEEACFIINNYESSDYTSRRARFEKKIPNSKLSEHYVKLAEIFWSQDLFKWDNIDFMPYNPFILVGSESHAKASKAEVFGEW